MLDRFFKSKKHKEIATYLIFGVMTTAVNWIVSFFLFYKLEFSAAFSTAIAWVISVLFAFFTNKPFVFESNDWSPKIVFPELAKFIGTRVFSGALEVGIVKLTIDYLALNPIIWKIAASVLVVILNYIFSKLITFRKK